MAAPGSVALFAADDAQMAAIGAILAETFEPGDVIALAGGLGAGKTTLARAIVRAVCGDPDMDVPSPTFALVQPYRGVVHADLYRLADESELDELGLFEDLEAITLIEWPERAPTILERPGFTVAIEMGPGGEGRRLAVTSRGGREAGAVRAALARFAADGQNGTHG